MNAVPRSGVEDYACGLRVVGNAPGNLHAMSLFDATTVTPPAPCSRCGELVNAVSMFCPACGQSGIRPLPAPVVDEPDPLSEAEPEPDHQQQEQTTDPLQRATGWLRRSLNLGKRPISDEEKGTGQSTPVDHPTEAMSLFEIEEAEKVSHDKPRKKQASLRFVLKFESGLSFTIGDTPGVMGTSPMPEEPEEGLHRISVFDEAGTVAEEHLQFGVSRGVFWVKDLQTVAGTVVEEPGSPALQCIPLDTYSLVRGSRVRLGGLSFTLH